jgi:hypothetical protein
MACSAKDLDVSRVERCSSVSQFPDVIGKGATFDARAAMLADAACSSDAIGSQFLPLCRLVERLGTLSWNAYVTR